MKKEIELILLNGQDNKTGCVIGKTDRKDLYMKENEAIEKLKAYLKCQRLQVRGIYEDCNEDLCDNCDLCYMQGTAGEHIKSIEIAIQALEKQEKIEEVFTHYDFYGCEINVNDYISALSEIKAILKE